MTTEPTPGAVTRALIIFNPAAGQAGALQEALDEAAAVWRAAGWQVDLRPTEGPGDATRIAREGAAEGYDVVAAAGGDGTVNEVVNGLAHTKAALAAIPVGTVNVWVRELGWELNPRTVAESYLKSVVKQIDLGKANDRYFLLMAGVGFDAAVTAEVDSKIKKRFGVLAYAWRAITLGMNFQATRTRITIDGKPRPGRVIMVVLGNSQLYGGFVKMTARASINDGLLDVCIIRGKSLLSIPARLISVMRRRYSADPDIEYHRARMIKIESREPLEVQVDGDHLGQTPMTFEAVPGALYALMPETLDTDLLRDEPPTQPRRAWRQVLTPRGRKRQQS